MGTTQDSISIFVFIDALGWRLFERHGLADDLFNAHAPLETIFGYSCTCDPTILTGCLPRDHKHFSFFVHNPARSPFRWMSPLRFAPSMVADRMRVRSHISAITARALGYTGYFNLYQVPFSRLPFLDYTEKNDLYQAGGINGGQPTIFDHLRRERIPFHLSDWRGSERRNLEALGKALDRGEPRFAYLYLAELDAILHREGTSGPRVAPKIGAYAENLRALVHRAERRYREVRLFVFSDHGMADVTEEVDLLPRIERLGLRYGRDYGAVYDSTMARFWFFSERARCQITALLENEPRGKILCDDDLRRYGANFSDRRYGELFFLLRSGALMVPSYMGLKRIAGMHGYAPEHPDSAAFFASNVPLTSMPRRLDDLFGLMAAEAGIAGTIS